VEAGFATAGVPSTTVSAKVMTARRVASGVKKSLRFMGISPFLKSVYFALTLNATESGKGDHRARKNKYRLSRLTF
jgi:hypothetical protein